MKATIDIERSTNAAILLVAEQGLGCVVNIIFCFFVVNLRGQRQRQGDELAHRALRYLRGITRVSPTADGGYCIK